MNDLYREFVNRYPVSKTLRFSLIPQYETANLIKENDLIKLDEQRAKNYVALKPALDACHKKYMDEILSGVEVDWAPLYDALEAYQKEKSEAKKSKLEKLQLQYRTNISKAFKNRISATDLIEETIEKAGEDNPQYYVPEFKDHIDEVRSFHRLTTAYFVNYNQARENMYAPDGSTSVAYRIVNENFPKFISNIRSYKSLPDEFKDTVKEQLTELLSGCSPDDIFSVSYYNKVLSQKGIEAYNTVLGGVSIEGNIKQQGLNELCNLGFQQGKLDSKIRFCPLFKQILSDREQISFRPEPFQTDGELISSLKAYILALSSVFSENAENLRTAFLTSDTQHIYIQKSGLSSLALLLGLEWNHFYSKEKQSGYTTVFALDQDETANILPKAYTLIREQIDLAVEKAHKVTDLPDNTILTSDHFVVIKEYLDTLRELEHRLAIFVAPEDIEKDPVFYSVVDEMYEELRASILLYNKTRNYATKKPYSEEKFKLTFQSPTLLKGWDQNKELDNCCMLFRQNGEYYLGILNPRDKPVFTRESSPGSKDCFEKMEYKYLPDPSKMLPKVFNKSKKWIAEHGIDADIEEGYELGKHKQGSSFDLNFLHKLCDYYKDCIHKYDDWSVFDLKFSDTKSYTNLNDFYNEIKAQNYKISFSYVDKEEIQKAVSCGQMYFFKIHNKDFSEYSKGSPNLHTIYWNNLFSEENLAKPLTKLNGEAELFYRRASIVSPFSHNVGSILVNKRDKNGNEVPSDRYISASCDAENNVSLEELKEKYPELVFKKADREIIKDRRYTKDAFSFHVPITFNYGCIGKARCNSDVLNTIKNEDLFYIGIDRGERHLLYVCVIDSRGNIVEQKSLNVINGIDYRAKLDVLEKERQDARKNWTSVTKIKDLKNGYLSVAINEIVRLMMKYPGIVVMEDLNFGFKHGRVHIEKQVYQNFERMLINKLNFCVLKGSGDSEPGGVRKAYQLTEAFTSFKELGKQSGFLFYVPAGYTSKIDPVTGFVNLFTSEQLKYSSVEKAEAFFGKMKEISYDRKYDCFRFSFDYRDFDLRKQDFTNKWAVCSAGTGRLRHREDNHRHFFDSVDVTAELKALFSEFGIDCRKSDLQAEILTVTKPEFYRRLLGLFALIVQLRYEDDSEDFILSPVLCENRFFDSRTANEQLPLNGDANGAYHIALQGLRLVSERIEDGKLKYDEKNKQNYNWFRFAQLKPYREL